MKYTLGIIGFGFVGTAIQHGFAQSADFRIYDKDIGRSTHSLVETIAESDVVFICLPTPTNFKTGSIDLSIMDSVINEIADVVKNLKLDTIITIKSTIIPGTTDSYKEQHPHLRLVFNPEFLTERTHKLDFINQSRIILGGDEKDTIALEELYKERFPMTPIYHTSAIGAELVKYFSNCFFAVKLSYFNEMYEVCQKLDLQYDDIIKMVLADGRIGNSHYSVPGHDQLKGWGQKCFPKDLNAMINKAKELGVDPLMMEAAWKKNLQVREVYDWLDIEGAASED